MIGGLASTLDFAGFALRRVGRSLPLKAGGAPPEYRYQARAVFWVLRLAVPRLDHTAPVSPFSPGRSPRLRESPADTGGISCALPTRRARLRSANGSVGGQERQWPPKMAAEAGVRHGRCRRSHARSAARRRETPSLNQPSAVPWGALEVTRERLRGTKACGVPSIAMPGPLTTTRGARGGG